ncbi:MAG: hypothetical protein ACYCO3_07670 [Mycobacteriales bacterium]
MTLLAITRGKASPGATTTATALAAVWPRPALLAECDPFGGDLALRLADEHGRPLVRDRGLVSLAPAARNGLHHYQLAGHVQKVAGGLEVLVGVESPAQADAMAVSWPGIADLLGGLTDVDVVCDCGLFTGAGPALPVLAGADLLVLLVRVSVEGLAHGRHAIAAAAELTTHRPRLAVVAVGGAAPAGPVGQLRGLLAKSGLAVETVGWLPEDPAAAGLFAPWSRRLDRSRYLSAVRELAAQLIAWTTFADLAGPVPVTTLTQLAAAGEG